MDFGAAAAAASQSIGGLSIFDDETTVTAVDASPSLQRRTRLPTASEAKGDIPATAAGRAAGKGSVADIQARTPAGRKQPHKHELGYSSSGSGGGGVQALAQKCNRTAKNGREQRRAQRISDVIDQLKGTLDKANFSRGSSSKLHVLVSCESYLRTLREKIRCYEMEAKLREAARGHPQPSPPSVKAPPNAAGPIIDDKISVWAAGKSNKSASSGGGSSRSGETDRMDTGDDCSSTSSTGAGTSSRRRRRRNKSTDNSSKNNKEQVPPPPLYSVSSSSDDDENSLGRSSGADGGGVLGIAGVARRGSSTDNSSGSGTGSDGDTGSSDSGGGSTSVGTTDSGSQGFTTDTASRGFTTDSSFSGYTGSLGSGSADTGSADGGSEESEDGVSTSRMRVVNYFDIFRLSNVPMAIADKGGTLVDVNDAMRGFGRIPQEAVSTLTVRSLVAPESSQALQEAMSSMLAASSLPQDPLAAPQQQVGAKPFLANAGIGNRPTLLTVSLVYDENGAASAFHVALIPRNTGDDDAVEGGQDQRSSTEYDAEAPGGLVQKAPVQGGGSAMGIAADYWGEQEEEGGEGREEPAMAVARKRSPARAWDARGQTKSQKRRAAQA
eukprot:g9084.t1